MDREKLNIHNLHFMREDSLHSLADGLATSAAYAYKYGRINRRPLSFDHKSPGLGSYGLQGVGKFGGIVRPFDVALLSSFLVLEYTQKMD